jgi:pilus assembly protein Flp/PilA
MNVIRMWFSRSDARGASAVEYGLLIAGIAGIIVIAAFALGPLTQEMFSDTCNQVQSEASMTTTCNS